MAEDLVLPPFNPYIHHLMVGRVEFCTVKRVFNLFSKKEDSKPILIGQANMKKLLVEYKYVRDAAVDLQVEIDKIERKIRDGDKEAENDDALKDRTIKDYPLSTSGAFQIRLLVNAYNRKSYIWVRLFFHPKEEPEKLLPSKAGVMLSTEEDLLAWTNFVENCIK